MVIRKLKTGKYRLYSRGKPRRNLGTYPTLEQAKRRERQIQYFKR